MIWLNLGVSYHYRDTPWTNLGVFWCPDIQELHVYQMGRRQYQNTHFNTQNLKKFRRCALPPPDFLGLEMRILVHSPALLMNIQ